MSEHINTAATLFELPATNPGIEDLLPEYQAAELARLEQDRAAIQAGIAAKFTEHQDLVQPGENGAEVLELQRSWQGGGAKRPEMAKVTLARLTDAAGNTSTDMTFSSKHAWTSHATAVTVGGVTRVVTEHGYENLDARTWRQNIEKSNPLPPQPAKRRLGAFLGRQATRI